MRESFEESSCRAKESIRKAVCPHVPLDQLVGKEDGLVKVLAGAHDKKRSWAEEGGSSGGPQDVWNICRERIRRTEAQLELNMAAVVKDRLKMFL